MMRNQKNGEIKNMNIFNKNNILVFCIVVLTLGCTKYNDEIEKALRIHDSVPSKVEDRTVRWYASREEVSKQIIDICNSNTSTYSQREDCLNAKGAEYAKLITSDKDLKNDLRLIEDRKYLKGIMKTKN